MQLDDDVGKVAASVPLIICILVFDEVFNGFCSVRLYAINMHLLIYWHFPGTCRGFDIAKRLMGQN